MIPLGTMQSAAGEPDSLPSPDNQMEGGCKTAQAKPRRSASLRLCWAQPYLQKVRETGDPTYWSGGKAEEAPTALDLKPDDFAR